MKQRDPNNYWEQLERLEKLKGSSELKAGVLFSFHSVVLGIFIEKIDFFKNILNDHIFIFILAGIWAILSLISIYFSFKCFMPRIERKFPKNVFFFRNAANSFGDIDEYTEKLTEICSSYDNISTELSHQIYIESKIIDLKFKNVQNSIIYFVLSFIVLSIILALITIN